MKLQILAFVPFLAFPAEASQYHTRFAPLKDFVYDARACVNQQKVVQQSWFNKCFTNYITRKMSTRKSKTLASFLDDIDSINIRPNHAKDAKVNCPKWFKELRDNDSNASKCVDFFNTWDDFSYATGSAALKAEYENKRHLAVQDVISSFEKFEDELDTSNKKVKQTLSKMNKFLYKDQSRLNEKRLSFLIALIEKIVPDGYRSEYAGDIMTSNAIAEFLGKQVKKIKHLQNARRMKEDAEGNSVLKQWLELHLFHKE